MSFSVVGFNSLSTRIIDAQRDGSHTDYAIEVSLGQEKEVVYRRFSAFLQLQNLCKKHFAECRSCCGQGTRIQSACLLEHYLRPVFELTEFPKTQFSLTSKNSKHLVKERIILLNAFLSDLEEALSKCPRQVLETCEKKKCKLSFLLKSFYGGLVAGPKTSSY